MVASGRLNQDRFWVLQSTGASRAGSRGHPAIQIRSTPRDIRTGLDRHRAANRDPQQIKLRELAIVAPPRLREFRHRWPTTPQHGLIADPALARLQRYDAARR